MIDIVDTNKITDKLVIRDSCDLLIIGDTHKDIDIELERENLRCDVKCLVLCKSGSNQNINVRINHTRKSCVSVLRVYSVLYSKSKLRVRGKVNIAHKADKSEAYFGSESLVLGDGSTVNAIPQLDIRNKNSKVSHNAVIATITDEDLWFLTSRGIDRNAAQDTFIVGFLTRDLDTHRALVVQEWLSKHE